MALIKTIEELRGYFPARITFDVDDILPTVREVEQEFLVEQVLGEGQYNELHTAYQANSLSSAQAALRSKCLPAIMGLTLHRYTGVANVEFTSGGLTVGRTEHQAPASEWRTTAFERSQLRSGYRGLDVLIGFLVANANDYPTWTDSAQAAALRIGFLRTTQGFDALVRIGNSGYLFQRMLPTIRRIEAGAVKATLCSDSYYNTLIEHITAASLTADEKAVVMLCEAATAHMAMADSIVELSLNVDQYGVWTFGSLVGGETSGGPAPADNSRLQHRITHHRDLGKSYLDQLRKLLQAQAEADNTHPYRSSACFVDPSAETPERFRTDSPVGGFM